jgi:hypothetical protein
MAANVPSAAEFAARYPSFGQAPLALVEQKLEEAARWTNESLYTDAATEADAVCMKAAVLLSITPEARKLQLVDDAQAKVWGRQLFRLQRAATMGLRTFVGLLGLLVGLAELLVA